MLTDKQKQDALALRGTLTKGRIAIELNISEYQVHHVFYGTQIPLSNKEPKEYFYKGFIYKRNNWSSWMIIGSEKIYLATETVCKKVIDTWLERKGYLKNPDEDIDYNKEVPVFERPPAIYSNKNHNQ